MDKIIEFGNVKLTPAQRGYVLTIKDQFCRVPVEHTLTLTEEELIELYKVLMFLTEEVTWQLYDKVKEMYNGSK